MTAYVRTEEAPRLPAPANIVGWRAAVRERPWAPVVLPDGYRKPAGRAHYLRANLRRDGERLIAALHPKQGSAMLSSLVGIDALVEVDAASTGIAPGATTRAMLLQAV